VTHEVGEGQKRGYGRAQGHQFKCEKKKSSTKNVSASNEGGWGSYKKGKKPGKRLSRQEKAAAKRNENAFAEILGYADVGKREGSPGPSSPPKKRGEVHALIQRSENKVQAKRVGGKGVPSTAARSREWYSSATAS